MAKDNSANSAPEQIYKTEQFEMFLKTLKQDSYAHWKEIAEVIGVDRDTISAWKKHPRAQQIINDGIAEAIQNMTIAGKKDWRMWEAKLKLLGLTPINKHELEHKNNPIDRILERYGLDAGKIEKTSSRSLEDTTRD